MSETLKIPIYVRYDEWKDDHSLSGIWESLIWLEELLPKLIEISGIDGAEVKVSIKEVKWGCIIFGLDLNVIYAVEVFKSAKEIYDIINFIDVWELYEAGNNWVTENPLWAALIGWSLQVWNAYKEKLKKLLSKFLVELIKILPHEKDRVSTVVNWKSIPSKIAQKAHKLVQKSYFKKALKPVFSWSVKSIDFSEGSSFSKKASIHKDNAWDFVSDKEQVLSEWGLFWEKTVTGKFVWWQRKKWTSLVFRVDWLPKKYRDLVCFPGPQEDITDFAEYLPKENLELKTEISRVTLYEKPKLIVKTIKSIETSMFE